MPVELYESGAAHFETHVWEGTERVHALPLPAKRPSWMPRLNRSSRPNQNWYRSPPLTANPAKAARFWPASQYVETRQDKPQSKYQQAASEYKTCKHIIEAIMQALFFACLPTLRLCRCCWRRSYCIARWFGPKRKLMQRSY